MILVRARYPQAQTWESYEAETEKEIVEQIKSELSDPENFVLSVVWDFDGFNADDANPITWEELQEY